MLKLLSLLSPRRCLRFLITSCGVSGWGGGQRRSTILVITLFSLQAIAFVSYVTWSKEVRQWVTFSLSERSFSSTSSNSSSIQLRDSLFDPFEDVPELNVEEIEQSSDCVAAFLQRYNVYCQAVMTPNDTDVTKPLCPCVPPTLSPVNLNGVQLSDKLLPTNLNAGGQWAPTDCRPRQRIALIIPYRGRQHHLSKLLIIINPFLQRQQANYTIFVVEQIEPKTWFNKAMLMNAGFLEVRARGPFDCYIFHDVDMLPEDDRNIYSCSKSPRHVGAYVNKWHYNLLYPRIFGGATAFREKHILTINGFSNEFWGWGGEDDDMLKSLVAVSMRPDVYERLGLNTLKYEVARKIEAGLHYTWIPIKLPEPVFQQLTTVTDTPPTPRHSTAKSANTSAPQR